MNERQFSEDLWRNRLILSLEVETEKEEKVEGKQESEREEINKKVNEETYCKNKQEITSRRDKKLKKQRYKEDEDYE